MNAIMLCNVPNLDVNYNHSFTFRDLKQQMDYFISNVKSIYNNVTINYDYYTSYLFNEEITTFDLGNKIKTIRTFPI